MGSPDDPVELQLLTEIAGFSQDPLGFVLFAFAWGEGELQDYPEGPDDWQRDILNLIGEGLRAGDLTAQEAIQIAVASGHGIGKSALVSWLVLWAACTFEDTRGVVTANTEMQLRTKTWAELSKWYRRCICAPMMFELTATAMYSRDKDHEKTWRIDMVAWSERNTEAFAGLHNLGKRVLLIFDEASAIPDAIWEVSEGALTDNDTEIIWAVFGNPTRNTGRFRECFGRFKHRWKTRQIDSRTVRISNKVQLQKWIDDYGEDSDFARIRVRGVFPRAGTAQFIGSDVIEGAAKREAVATMFEPLVLGVDVARYGDDESVIVIRKGRDAKTHAPIKRRGISTMQLAALVVEQKEFYQADAIFIDGGGVGGGVVDRLRQLGVDVYDIQFGASSDVTLPGDERVVYYNKAAEMWGSMRKWLEIGAIPDDPDLRSQLEGREYGFALKDGKDAIQLEKKKDMKKRGLPSPDWADALALTFAYKVMPRQNAGFAGAAHVRGSNVQSDYDPFNT